MQNTGMGICGVAKNAGEVEKSIKAVGYLEILALTVKAAENVIHPRYYRQGITLSWFAN